MRDNFSNLPSCVTKADLSEELLKNLSVDKHQANKIVEDWLEEIKLALDVEGKVMISGFGSFEVKTKKERLGRNPQTNERLTLPPRRVLKFKGSNILRAKMNGQEIGDEEETFS